MKRFLLLTAITLAGAGATFGFETTNNMWLNIYYPKGTVFKQFNLSDKKIRFDEDGQKILVEGDSAGINLLEIENFKISANTPRIDITGVVDANGREITEITSKVDYLKGKFTFSGMGLYDDVTADVNIRGRGNSTWTYPKKPYRLKFDKKQQVANMRKSKNLCLLANLGDPAMMRNAAAYIFGDIIGMPYINNMIPVEVYLNSIYKGSYQLTEKVGINSGSVDLTDEEEARSVLFEMDINEADADEYPFLDSTFGIQTLIKDPDAPADPAEQAEWLAYWRADFNDFTKTIKTGDAKAIFEKCDLQTFVKYIMVFNFACNQELVHPKSVNLWKLRDGKYNFGPCWDFDWCYGYFPGINPYPSQTYKNPLVRKGYGDGNGSHFFVPMIANDIFKAEFAKAWREFYDNKQEEFWKRFDEYVDLLEPSANHQSTKPDFNGEVIEWYQNYRNNVETIRNWIKNRIEFINSDPNMGLL